MERWRARERGREKKMKGEEIEREGEKKNERWIERGREK